MSHAVLRRALGVAVLGLTIALLTLVLRPVRPVGAQAATAATAAPHEGVQAMPLPGVAGGREWLLVDPRTGAVEHWRMAGEDEYVVRELGLGRVAAFERRVPVRRQPATPGR